jgi:hypothetical protein
VPERVYERTYWPAVSWAQRGDLALLLRQSTGVRGDETGALELLTVRDARLEKCDILGGTGSDPARHRIEWQIVRATSPGEAERAALSFNRPLAAFADTTTPAAVQDLPVARSLLAVEGEGVVTALKPAERGEGVILRALLLPGPLHVRLPGLAGVRLTRTDALERDLEDLGLAEDTLLLARERFGTLATVRLRVR